jgi:hypothetical protein
MRDLDALHAHIQQPQDERGIEARRAHDRCNPDPFGRHHRKLHIVQIVGGVLHIDESGIEARKPDDIDDLRVGDAADMRSQREAALSQNPLDPILSHDVLPRLLTPAWLAAGWRRSCRYP